MDHLPLPEDPILPLSRVPYVCDGKQYDDGNFSDYPVRAGWPQALPSDNRLPFWLMETKVPSDTGELEIFLQAWLFFGLLHQVLSPSGRYDARDYIATDEEDSYVHTKGLSASLREWYHKTQQLDEQRSGPIFTGILTSLHQASNAMQALDSGRGHPKFNRGIKVSLAVLVDTLLGAVVKGLEITTLPFWPVTSCYITFDPDIVDRMLTHGWCRHEIAQVQSEMLSTSALYHLQHMRRPDLGVDHSDCSEVDCSRLRIKPQSYRPRHTTNGCDCEPLSPDAAKVVECLRADTFPLLKVTGKSGTLDLEVVPYQRGLPYVALSHVWADGMGNPHACALPQWQISRLATLIRSLHGRTFRWDIDDVWTEERELYLWCDTLCCPVAPYRDKIGAIGKMRDVYLNATYVLILDTSLEYYSYVSIGHLEASMRLITSRWRRRLWTYQEAGLAQKILVNFADGVVEFRKLQEFAIEAHYNDVLSWSLTRDIRYTLLGFRAWFQVAQSGGKDIRNVLKELCHRGVSVASDEPLCLAAVLDVDVMAVSAAVPAVRMQKFWELLSKTTLGVPEEMIFNCLPRLSATGYRWAPATLLQPLAATEQLGDGLRLARGALTSRGLRLSRPGWRIRAGVLPPGIPETFMELSQSLSKLVYLRTADGSWFNVSKQAVTHDGPEVSLWRLLQDNTKDWHLIIEDSEAMNWGTTRKAVLASLSQHESDLSVYRSAMVVRVFRMQPGTERLLQVAYPIAVKLREKSWAMLGVVLLQLVVFGWNFLLPRFIRNAVAPLFDRTVQQLGAILRTRIITSMLGACTEASKRTEIADLLKSMNSGMPVHHIGGLVMPIFMGWLVEVTETFASTNTWYVD